MALKFSSFPTDGGPVWINPHLVRALFAAGDDEQFTVVVFDERHSIRVLGKPDQVAGLLFRVE